MGSEKSPLENMVNTQFWKDKPVFITGHTGFKGSWLCTLLTDVLKAKVTGYALEPPTTPSLFELLSLEKGLNHIEADVRDKKTLATAINQSQAEVVIHMAAQPLVQYGYQHPYETFETNFMGTLNLLEALRIQRFQGVTLIVTSDKVYLNPNHSKAFKESDPLGGKDPYSASKATTEHLVISYLNSYASVFQDRLVSARAGNVIGGGDWGQNRLLPDILRSYAKGEQVVLRNPTATRPWQHVLEPLSAYLILCEKMSRGELGEPHFNIGPTLESVWTVQKVTEYLAHHFQCSEPAWIQDPEPRPCEAKTLSLDIQRICDTGWKPILSLEETLDWVYQWHHAFQKGEDIGGVTRNQIHQFMEKMERV